MLFTDDMKASRKGKETENNRDSVTVHSSAQERHTGECTGERRAQHRAQHSKAVIRS
jgi:hypothetical protein